MVKREFHVHSKGKERQVVFAINKGNDNFFKLAVGYEYTPSLLKLG